MYGNKGENVVRMNRSREKRINAICEIEIQNWSVVPMIRNLI